MLRKRTRSVQKDQYKGHLMPDLASESDGLGHKHNKNNSLFGVPGLFVGFNIKGVSDSDSAWSPTSPLDSRFFTNLGNPFRSPRSAPNGAQKSWNSNKVGLGIVDSLDDVNKSSGKVLRSSESRNVLFGSQRRISVPYAENYRGRSIDSSLAPKSLPNNYGIPPHTQISNPNSRLGSSANSFAIGDMQLDLKPLGKIRSCLSDCGPPMSPFTRLTYYSHNSSSDDFCSEKNSNAVFPPNGGTLSIDNSLGMKPSSPPISISSVNGLVGSLSAKEIEQSEDYTCVISHGPNPRTTHIFGDCILECHTNELANCCKKREEGVGLFQPAECSNPSPPFPSNFLSFCYYCKKKLDEGKDIYMYRGEKAFCSCSCRDQEILVEEELEKAMNNLSRAPKSTCSDDIFGMGMVIDA